MSECVVRMEMPKEGCHTCDARCVSALYGYVCGIKRKDVMPFLGKKNRPDWCPILCQLPEWHGRLVDADALKDYLVAEAASYDLTQGQMGILSEAIDMIDEQPTIVPSAAERSDTK